jgi:PhnB protein
MRLNPYLHFNGQCEAAFQFYEKALGGKITMIMRFEDSPLSSQVAPDWRKKIIHATLTVGDQLLQGSDPPPGRYEKPQGFAVTINIADAGEAERIFKVLAENGTVQMPIQETFWAKRFGILVDQFGTPWMVNCGRPA